MKNDINVFTGLADNYEKARPGYAAGAVEYILTRLLPPDPVIADVGAGTGKLSELLAPGVRELYAVEPNADMRGKLEQTLGRFANARIYDGSAERTKLPDGSIDAVICAQALHWFDADAFRSECERILRPGGRIIVVYNLDESGELKCEAICNEFFGANYLRATFANFKRYDDIDSYLAYRLSRSSRPKSSEPGYDNYIAETYENYNNKNINGAYTIDFSTNVYSAI